jgi:hypothetical protein
MVDSMRMALEMVQQYCWIANIAGLLLIVFTRIFVHSRRAWGMTGAVLLTIASANAIAISQVGLNPSQTAASIFGIVVLGSLGARFLGNWLTDGSAWHCGLLRFTASAWGIDVDFRWTYPMTAFHPKPSFRHRLI